jgi:hypothetical protein
LSFSPLAATANHPTGSHSAVRPTLTLKPTALFG